MRYLALCMGLLAMPLGLGAADSLPRKLFDIPAGGAVAALKRFSAQAGTQVIFLEDAVNGAQTRAVKGEFTPSEALERLLAGTGLKSTRDDRSGAFAVNKPAKPDEGPPRPNAPRAVPTAPNERPPRPTQNQADQVVELSPFVVSSEQDHGYQAANTLAGSRLNTPLRDTAASISVLTDEFIRDIGALDLTEAIAFGNNVELDRTGGNQAFEFYDLFTIRGQAATVARNYFRWKLPTNTYNMERIEEARGPNAILFGFASAGGIISASTKQALANRSFRRAQLVYGSYDLRRATLDLNQASSDGRLGVRFNAVAAKTQGYQHYVFNEDTRGHLAVKYRLAPATVIRAEYEQGRTFGNKADYQEVGDNVLRWIQAGRPLVATPVANAAQGLALNGTAGNQSVVFIENDGIYADWRGQGVTLAAEGSSLITDPALVDPVNYRINLGGPTQTQEASFKACSVLLEHQPGPNTFLQLAYNHQSYDFEAWQAANATGLKGDPNRFLRDGATPNPHAGGLYFETNWTNYWRKESLDNFRLTASHEHDFGRWGEYRLAGLAERELSNWAKDNYQESWFDETTNTGAFFTQANVAGNRALRRHYITLRDSSTWFASEAHPGVAGYVSGLAAPADPARRLKTRLTRVATGDFDDPKEQDSYLLAAQAYHFGRRLVLAAGYRADTIHLHEGLRGLRDPATNDIIVDNVNHPRLNRTIRGHTRTLGAVWHARSWFSLLYNKSDSREPANIGIRLMPRPDADGHFIGSRVGDNPRGEGEDYGIDLNLADGRVFLRATRFHTIRTGAQRFTYGGTADNPTVLSDRVMDALLANSLVTAAEREQHRLNTGGSEFDVASTGYEVSLTANLTPNWRLQAGWSLTNAVTSRIAPEIQVWAATEMPYFQAFDQSITIPSTGQTIGQEIARWQAANAAGLSADGVGMIGHRPESASMITRYAFTAGPLKGGYVGAACRHQGRQLVGYNSARGEPIYGNSFTRADALVGYRFAPHSARPFLRGLSLQLNIYNILDQHDPLIGRIADPTSDGVVTANRLVPQEPRTWRLTLELAF